MRPFTYSQAQDAAAAIAEVSNNTSAAYLAGGTTLIDLVKLDVMQPDRLIDINVLPLSTIETLPSGSVRVGALVRNSDMAYNDTIRKNYPLLSEAILKGASGQIRNMATLGGNILQRTRCYYFRDTATPCNKRDPGSGCSAIDGINRIHAILGTSSKCIASNPSDMNVALTALGATINLRGPKGDRSVPFVDFHLLPGDHPERETVLQPGELILSVDIPPLPYAVRSRYIKVRDRASYAFALVSTAVALDVQQGVIREARLALGGIGAKPWRAFEAEKLLQGKAVGDAAFKAAAEAVVHGAKGYKHNSFKIELAKRTVIRALTTVGGMA